MQEAAKALEVLTQIMEHFDDGAPAVYADALLFEDERTLSEHVTEAVQLLDVMVNPREPAISRSQRRRLGKNAYGNWVGFIGKRKVKDFGKDQSEAWKWRNETE